MNNLCVGFQYYCEVIDWIRSIKIKFTRLQNIDQNIALLHSVIGCLCNYSQFALK